MKRHKHQTQRDEKSQPPLEEAAGAIGFPLDGMELLRTALTHVSRANEDGVESNERLEFLGDAVLGLVVGEYLYRRFPEAREGQLAKLRAYVVSAPVLAHTAGGLGFGHYLYLGRSEESTGGRTRESNLANAFEALVGAFYIHQGLEAARAFVLKRLTAEIDEACSGRNLNDYKTLLQEELQGRGERPVYEVIKEEGPEHIKKYTVAVSVSGRKLGEGRGRSKKEAEQAAARQAFEGERRN